MRYTLSLAACLAALGTGAFAGDAGPWSVASPDGKLVLTVADRPALAIRVTREGRPALPASPVGITFERAGAFVGGLRFEGKSAAVVDERYPMPVGKRSLCRDHANELTLDFANAAGARLSLILRAYDEGIAYRYRLHGAGDDTVASEASAFRIPKGSRGWFARYVPYYESRYEEHAGLEGVTYDLQVPALFETPGKRWLYFTEAAVDGTYAGARLKVEGDTLAYRTEGRPSSTLPWATPWRVAFVVDDLRQLIESTLVTNLSPPCALADTSWIRPGTDIFPWLTGPGTNNMSLARMKQFVDLAAEMGWKWIEFDNALALGNQGADAPDKWMACPWIPEVAAYANAKGISVYGWDHCRNLDTPEKRARILDWFVAHGFKGIKVDFLDSDDQARYRFREEIARACAERKLMLSYHGDITPRGMQRTWPNIATHEGVLGEEYYLFSDTAPTPAYNVNLVFTRNVPGSMDYTPTTFDLPGSKPGGRRTTTSAHEMALAVVFESGWQSMGFNPESAQGNPARAFLEGLPSAWDDIRFLAGRPGEFAVVARRKGPDWWIAGINAGTPHRVSLDLGFLKPGTYRTKLYHDAPAPKGDAGLEVTIANRGGINAVCSQIELWTNARPANPLPYTPPPGMEPAPAGWYLVAADDCGTPSGNAHLSGGQDWRYSPGEIPETALPAGDPARTLNYSFTELAYRFPNLDRSARYLLRVMYLSDKENRTQSLAVNGRELHGPLALPAQKVVCRSFEIAGSEMKEFAPSPLETKIAVDPVTIAPRKPLVISLPANGGFGVRIEPDR